MIPDVKNINSVNDQSNITSKKHYYFMRSFSTYEYNKAYKVVLIGLFPKERVKIVMCNELLK